MVRYVNRVARYRNHVACEACKENRVAHDVIRILHDVIRIFLLSCTVTRIFEKTV